MAPTRLRTFFVYIFIMVLAATPYLLQAKELKAVYAQGYLPFSWGDEQGVAKGVEVDFVKALLNEKLGLKVSHSILPWARAQAMIEEGQADIFVTIPNSKRRGYALVSEIPLFFSNFIMHTGSSNPKKNRLMAITSLQDLIAQKDIINGHIVGAGWHSVKLKNAEILKIAPSSLQILQLLDKNRIDVYIEQTPLIRYQIKALGFEGRITEIPQVIEETRWYICMGKKSSFVKLMPVINELLKKMKKTGELSKLSKDIFNQYQ